MMMKRLETCFFILFFLLFALNRALIAEISEDSIRIKEELGVKVTMRDGVRLSTNIYRPDQPGRFPTILMRTPYDNGGSGNWNGHSFAKYGYAVVIQDVRGRYESEGVFDAFQNEVTDGYDTQQWIGSQPWCNGKIGTWGASYEGFTQWLSAPLASPYLVAMFPMVAYSDIYDALVYYGGAFHLRLVSWWSCKMTVPTFADPNRSPYSLGDFWMSLPLMEQDRLMGWKVTFLRDWLSHPEQDLYWKRSSIGDGHSRIRAAVYNLGGWYDFCLGATLKNFTAMTANGIDPEVRRKQKLIIGPWIHSIWTITKEGKVADVEFGKNAVIDYHELQLRWFDSQLKGEDNGIMKEDPVKIFVMGDNVWRTEKEWPLAWTQYRKYYFHSRGRANTLNGDGVLDTVPPADKVPDRFVYDPVFPVPFTHEGPTDQRPLEDRDDVLVYSSPVLENDLEVTGPLETIIYASSSAPNTDFTAKLVDVFPDGRAIRLCDGIIRASFRDGKVNTSNIEPGKVYKYVVDLWATSNVFKKGHRIRVEISSSNFPRFDRNLNTGRNFALDRTWAKAQQAIFHNRDYPSCIVLPVIGKNQ